jgi:hypothetical protein
MFTAASGSVAPKTRKGRTATVQPSTNFINSNRHANTIETMRKQRLRVMGIYDYRADLIASLVWGDAA